MSRANALVGALMVALIDPARAADMLLRDRLAILYSNQVIFDRTGEPLVSVRVGHGRDQFEFTSGGRLTLMPGGDGRGRVRAPASARWTVTVHNARPGRVRHWVAVARLPAADLARVAAARKAWTERGHEVQLFESGALIALAGRTLDTRRVAIAVDPSDTAEDAAARAAALAHNHPILGEITEELVERPGGTLVATEARTGIEVRAPDLLWLSPQDHHTVDVEGVSTAHDGRHGTGRYRGDVYLAVGQDGRLVVVNLVSAETLLKGVVPAEIFPSAPDAALRTQAVAARGQLVAKIGTRHRGDPYLLCSEVHCQVYRGSERGTKRTDAAVEHTRGRLLFHTHGLVDTVYSSACGGHSEAYHLIWHDSGGEPKPALGGVADTPAPFDGPNPEDVADYIDHPPADAYCVDTGRRAGVFRWLAERTGEFVTRAVNERAEIGPVRDIRVLRRGVSGRALALAYVGERGEHVVEGEYANRRLLGGLKSGLWVLTREGPVDAPPTKWRFRGGGFGHGVGMCQHGAMGQATRGRTYEQILGHYYPGGVLRRIW